MAQKNTPSAGEEPLTMKLFESKIGAYIRRGEWIRSARNPSNYGLYRSLKGRVPTRGHGRLYYPHLFVCHAIWGPEDWGVRLIYEFSAHWGVLFNMDKLTYPKIDDPNKEYLLFLGKTPVKSGGGNQSAMYRTSNMVEPPRHDRGPLPLRPTGGAGAPAGKQPPKLVQNVTGQVVKLASPQENEVGIKQEVRCLNPVNQPRVVQGAVRPDGVNTKQAHTQPCQAMQTTA